MKPLIIKGRGGKGGAGEVRTPREDPNSLQSRAYARFIDLLSEGPIDGFCTEDNVKIEDAVLNRVVWSFDGDGGIYLDPANYVSDVYGIVYANATGGAIFETNSGYPGYFTNDTSKSHVRCIIEGDGEGAEIYAIRYPKNETERSFMTLGDFSGLSMYAEGRLRGLYVVSRGTGYTAENTRISVPAASGQAIYIDDRPLLSKEDLSFNFSDVKIAYRMGYEDQQPMAGFDQVEEVVEINPGTDPIAYGEQNAYSFVVESQEFDKLAVTLIFPEGLYVANIENGDIKAISENKPVRFKIEQRFAESGSSYSAFSNFGTGIYSVSGKTMSSYQRTIEADLVKPEHGKRYTWEIRITRLTYDDDDETQWAANLARKTGFRLDTVTGITDARLTYPYSAVVGISVNAEQFSSIPTRGYRLRLKRVMVPSNYFPPYTVEELDAGNGAIRTTIRQYGEYNRGSDGLPVYDAGGNKVEQIWDGTFYEAWTNNPAWIAYYIISDRRAGLGRRFDETLVNQSRWWYYQIARYCDQLVDTGYFNGAYTRQEPRFTCNTYLQTREEAFRVLSDIASSFVGYFYFAHGVVIPVQDAKKVVNTQTRFQFTQANVENGIFDYRGTARKVRHTVAVIKFNDPDNGFKLTPVYYEDVEGILRYGIQTLEKTAFGCTSRGQARRFAKRLIRQELSNTDTISFVTGLLGSVMRPGDVFAVYDKSRSSVPFGGRVASVNIVESDSKPSIGLDRFVDLEAAGLSTTPTEYAIVFVLPQGETDVSEITTAEQLDELVKRQITSPLQIASFDKDPLGRTIVKLNTDLPSGVTAGTIWGIQHASVKPQYFRTLGIEEVGKHKFSVTGIEYHEALYDEVDFDDPYDEEPVNPDLDKWKQPGPPENLRISYVIRKDLDGNRIYMIHLSWSRPASYFVSSYDVEIRKGLGNYQFVTSTKNYSVEIVVPEADNYCFNVYSIGLTKARSRPGQICTTIEDAALEELYNTEIISGLELLGQGNDNQFYGTDIVLDWRVNWARIALYSTTFQQQSGTYPVMPPSVQEYQIKVYDPNNNLITELSRYETDWTLSAATNRSLKDGPHRDLIISVAAVTYDGKVSKATKLRVYNELPPQLTSADVTTADTKLGGVTVRFPASSQQDHGGYRVWMSETPGFIPDDTNLVYDGRSTITPPLSIPGAGYVTTYYIRYAEYDQLSSSVLDCNISDEVSQSVTAVQTQATLSVFDFLNRS